MPHGGDTVHLLRHNPSGNPLQRPTIRSCPSASLTRHTRCQNEEPLRTRANLRLAAMKSLAAQDRRSPLFASNYSTSKIQRRPCYAERKAGPQPPETKPRRSTGASNLPAPAQTEGAAAVGSSVKLDALFMADVGKGPQGSWFPRDSNAVW